ncbi:MAG: hypothetical protein U0871_24485 [Gemmataceae bacterium]
MAATEDFDLAVGTIALTSAMVVGIGFAVAHLCWDKRRRLDNRVRIAFWFSVIGCLGGGISYLHAASQYRDVEAVRWTADGAMSGFLVGIAVVVGMSRSIKVGHDA